jgi:acylphosphatase
MHACRRFVVSGRVQGVGFRAWAREQAESLHITGWAMNLPDGRVEVLACGDPGAVERLAAMLHQGPPAARVTAVDEQEAEMMRLLRFAIR